MRYRAEIDGLRAVAVVPVILFHAGFEMFSGGFVGVDVFFVISGYLITTILIEDIEHKRFSLLSFYERRARRILPALFLVMLACLPAAWMWMLPNQMLDFSQSLVAVSAFISNILFWAESGYFSAAAEQKPLLHTWSLAVEEQYYLLFPIFLFFAWRLGRPKLFWLIVIFAAISLGVSEWGWRNSPAANFYLATSRAWELLAGSIAAFLVQKHGVRHNNPLSLIGLFAIIFAILFFDKSTPMPSVYGLVPVGGVVLLVLFADKDTIAAKILSLRALVAIGLISYSAYLWHQPLFAFARIRFHDHLDSNVMLALSAASLVLAYVSWKYIEGPFRGKDRVSRKAIAVFSAAGILFFVTVGLIGHFANGFENRLSDQEREILAWKNYSSKAPYLEGTCFMRPEQSFEEFEAGCVKPGSSLILGDSHAAALSSGWRIMDPNISQLTGAACPPILNERFRPRPHCRAINNFAIDRAIEAGAKTVYLHANWQAYELEKIQNLDQTIRTLKAGGIKDIVVVGGVPQYYPSLPDVLVQRGMSMNNEYWAANDTSKILERDEELRAITTRSGARFVSLLDVLCREDRCLAVMQTGKTFSTTAWDYGHLTQPASQMVSRGIISALNKSDQGQR